MFVLQGPIPCYCCGRIAFTTSPNDRFAEPVANYAYLRVVHPHAGRREPHHQRSEVLERPGDRRLLETADAGDVLVAAEVSRLARSTLQVLELLQAAADRGVTVHIAKNRMVLDQSLPATITATILGLAAQIEREFISARTKRGA